MDPLVRTADDGGLRRDVDDGSARAAAVGSHPHRGLAGAHERAGDVDGPQAGEHRGVDHVDGAVAAGDAGVVDEPVEPPEPLVDRGEHRHDRCLVGHVGSLHQHRRAECSCTFGDLGGCVHCGCMVEHHVEGGRRSQHHSGTDAARAAGHQHHRTAVRAGIRIGRRIRVRARTRHVSHARTPRARAAGRGCPTTRCR